MSGKTSNDDCTDIQQTLHEIFNLIGTHQAGIFLAQIFQTYFDGHIESTTQQNLTFGDHVAMISYKDPVSAWLEGLQVSDPQKWLALRSASRTTESEVPAGQHYKTEDHDQSKHGNLKAVLLCLINLYTDDH